MAAAEYIRHQNNLSEEIVSSTGSLGLEVRGDTRLYWNVPHFVTDADQVINAFDRLGNVTTFKPERGIDSREYSPESGQRRDVMRFVGSADVVRNIITAESALSDSIEAIAPISANEWYVMVARNGERRKSTRDLDTMIEQTSNAHQTVRHPIEIIDRVLREGNFSFTTDLSDEKTQGDVHALWEVPFGWTKDQVQTFSDRLQEERFDTGIPTIWFSALEVDDPESANGKTVVGAAMAETITFTGEQGRQIPIVELTEWSVGENFRGNGYMAATVSQLTSQVLHDYRTQGMDAPFIIAECNIPAYAYKSGFSAGLRVPERVLFGEKPVPQIIQQNVTVGDGLYPAGLRDFALMCLPQEIIDTYFTPDAVNYAVGLGRK